jgi:hypothetical protein
MNANQILEFTAGQLHFLHQEEEENKERLDIRFSPAPHADEPSGGIGEQPYLQKESILLRHQEDDFNDILDGEVS